MLSFAAVHDAARGRWSEILAGLGVEPAHLQDKHGPCPGCAGVDRFRFDNQEDRGTWICSQGGGGEVAGDGFDLLLHAGLAAGRSDALTRVAEWLGLGRDKAPTAGRSEPRRPLSTAEYHYRREDGSTAYVVTVKRYSNAPKDVWQETDKGLSPSRDADFVPLPYRLDELTDHLANRSTIYIVEGEKCADTMWDLGLPATTNSGGARNWHAELTHWFADCPIVVLPDCDEAGEAHLKSVVEALTRVAASIRVVRLPDLEPGGDVADWIAAGRTRDDLDREIAQADDGLGGMSIQKLLRTEFVIPEAPHRYIPAGFTLLAGAPKVGKSTFCEWVASEVARSAPVIYLALEYSWPMAQQRFQWMDPAALDLHLYAEGTLPRMGAGGEREFELALITLRPRLVIVDTLARFKRPAATDGYEAETAALGELKAMLDRHDTSAVAIHHTRKSSVLDEADNPFERILGSTALAAVPDNLVVLLSDAGRTVVHTRGRMISTSKRIFDLRGHDFIEDTSPGAALIGKADVQAGILQLLADGPLSQRAIGEELGLEKGNVSRLMRKLEKARRVTRESLREPWRLQEDHF